MSKSIGRLFPLVAVLALVFPATAAAQQGVIELGVDAGMELDILDAPEGVELDDLFSVALPGQRFRVGFFVNDQVAVEPGVRLNYMDFGEESTTDFALDVGLVYHFSDNPDVTRGFVHGGGIVNIFDTSASDSQSQFGVFAGVGAKVPMANRLAVRFEGNAIRAFETDDALAYWGLQGVIGLSFFTE